MTRVVATLGARLTAATLGVRLTAATLGGLLAAAIVAAITNATVVGSAATLEVRAATLGAGSASVVCDDDILHRFVSAPGDPLTMTRLQVWTIDMPDCRDHELIWAVVDHDGRVLDGGTAIVTSASMPFMLARPLPAAEIARVDVVVRGGPAHPGTGKGTGKGNGNGNGRGNGRGGGLPGVVIHLS